MAKNYVESGNRLAIPTSTITKDVVSGELVAISELHGIVLHTKSANESNVLGVGHVWRIAKITGAGTAGAIGAIAYSKDDSGTLKCTGEVATNKPIGTFIANAADGDATALVKLKETWG